MAILRSHLVSLLAEISNNPQRRPDEQICADLFHLFDSRDVKLVHLAPASILENQTPSDAAGLYLHLDLINSAPHQVLAIETVIETSQDPDEAEQWTLGYETPSGEFVAKPEYQKLPAYLHSTDAAFWFRTGLMPASGLDMHVVESPGEWGWKYEVTFVDPALGSAVAVCANDILARSIVGACLQLLLNGWHDKFSRHEVVEDI